MTMLADLKARLTKTAPFQLFPEHDGRDSGPRTVRPRLRSSMPPCDARSAGRAATGTRSPQATASAQEPVGTSVAGIEVGRLARTARHAACRARRMPTPGRRARHRQGGLRDPHLSVARLAARRDCAIRLARRFPRTTTASSPGCAWTVPALSQQRILRCLVHAPTAPDYTPSQGLSAHVSRATSSPTAWIRGMDRGFTRIRLRAFRCSHTRRSTRTSPTNQTGSLSPSRSASAGSVFRWWPNSPARSRARS